MEVITINAWKNEIALVAEIQGNIVIELQDDKYKCFSPILFEGTNQVKEVLNSDISKIGILADSISGAYGKNYFNNYFINEYSIKPTILNRLSFIGANGLGALEFEPSNNSAHPKIDMTFSLNAFKQQSIDVYNGEAQDISPELARLIAKSNSGAGGAKAKAIVDYNPDTKMVHLSQINDEADESYKKCIVKFNNSTNEKEKNRFNDELKLEYIYYLLAKQAGVVMSQSWLEKDEDENYYFITERFDIDSKGNRLHMHSLAGILSHDASSFTMGYESLFRVGLMLGVPQKDKEQMFKTMLFNIVFANRDDHSRNFSFLMDEDCNWNYAPAYDLTYSASNYAIAWHQLQVASKPTVNIKELDLKNIAKLCNIKNPLEIISEMIKLKKERLGTLCRKYDVTKYIESISDDTKQIDSRFYKGDSI